MQMLMCITYRHKEYADAFVRMVNNLGALCVESWRCGVFLSDFAAEFTVFCAEWLLMVGVGTLETGKVAGTM